MKTRYFHFLFLFLFLFGGTSVQSQQAEQSFEVVCVGFYNLENLFDTLDTEDVEDTEFTPQGENQWNTKRYKEKLQHLSKVIAEIGTATTPDGPAILGVSEIENRKVLEDLVQTPKLKSRNYSIVHHNSPGDRGVDVALLYQPKYFKVNTTKNYTLTIEDKPDFKTRDLMLVSGELLGEHVHIMVDHWPSRYGGEARSRPLRNAAARLTRQVIDSLLAADPAEKIIFMGDLNDDPVNESVDVHLNTTGKKRNAKDGMLYNPMYSLYQKGIGTLAWQDNWNLFDQVILSPAWLDKDHRSFQYYQAKIFNKKYLKQTSGNYKGYPHRTYVGDTYRGGYSDHFPVYVLLIRKKR